MPKISCGLLLYRPSGDSYEIFLCHPGGPLFAKKDLGCWSLPKGETQPGEELLTTAIRECKEETGHTILGPFVALTPVHTPAKTYFAWYVSSNLDPSTCYSNSFTMFGSSYPEIDKYTWFSLAQAKTKIHPNQLPFVNEFISKILNL